MHSRGHDKTKKQKKARACQPSSGGSLAGGLKQTGKATLQRTQFELPPILVVFVVVSGLCPSMEFPVDRKRFCSGWVPEGSLAGIFWVGFGVWAAPGGFQTVQKCRGASSPTFYLRFPAAGPPPTTGFRSVWAFFFDDPGYQGESFTCHRLKGVCRP